MNSRTVGCGQKMRIIEMRKEGTQDMTGGLNSCSHGGKPCTEATFYYNECTKCYYVHTEHSCML